MDDTWEVVFCFDVTYRLNNDLRKKIKSGKTGISYYKEKYIFQEF